LACNTHSHLGFRGVTTVRKGSNPVIWSAGIKHQIFTAMDGPMDEASALVLFSGGQDSTTCLAWALERFDRVETVGLREFVRAAPLALGVPPQRLQREAEAVWRGRSPGAKSETRRGP